MATTRKQVIEGMRRAFEKVKSHERFTGRVKKAFEAELPHCVIYFKASEAFSSPRLAVWGINHDVCVEVILWDDAARPTWQEQFAHGLAVQDFSDYAEREAEEAKIAPQLAKIEAAIVALREKAAGMIAALPVPPSATVRADAHSWTSPRSETAEKFPHCFRSLARH